MGSRAEWAGTPLVVVVVVEQPDSAVLGCFEGQVLHVVADCHHPVHRLPSLFLVLVLVLLHHRPDRSGGGERPDQLGGHHAEP